MRRVAWFAVAILVLLAVVRLNQGSGNASVSSPGHQGQLTVHFNAITTFNTLTISPSDAQCGHYHGGTYPNASTNTLGQPNGMCSVGRYPATNVQDVPIKITYSGLAGNVLIRSGNAIPANNGTQWRLCGEGVAPHSGCTGPGGKPGSYQFAVKNFDGSGLGPTSLRPWWTCDVNFDPSGGCTAVRKQSQQEGFDIIGPHWQKNPSTTWTVTIDWMAAPPK